jgi:hypothetical protein
LKKLINPFKLRNFCGVDGIPYECLRHLPRWTLVHFTHLFNHCSQLPHFPKSKNEAKIITVPKSGKDPKFTQNLRQLAACPQQVNYLKKIIHNIVQKYTEERSLLNES